jgi:hypothetical protein
MSVDGVVNRLRREDGKAGAASVREQRLPLHPVQHGVGRGTEEVIDWILDTA